MTKKTNNHSMLAVEQIITLNHDSILYVVHEDSYPDIYSLQDSLAFFFPHHKIFILPHRESSWDAASLLEAQRAHTLALAPEEDRILILTTPEALEEKFHQGSVLKLKEKCTQFSECVEFLKTYYDRTHTVYSLGEFAIQGDIIDIFTASGETLRLDFFGNILEKICFFDPTTRLSEKKITDFILTPAKECVLNEETISYFLSHSSERLTPEQKNKIKNGILSEDTPHHPELFYPDVKNIREIFPVAFVVEDSSLQNPDGLTQSSIVTESSDFLWIQKIASQNPEETLQKCIDKKPESIHLVAFLNVADLKKFAQSVAFPTRHILSWEECSVAPLGSILLGVFSPQRSCILEDKNTKKNICLYRSQDILIESTVSTKNKKSSVLQITQLDSIQEGDFLVHYQYGIGQYQTIETLEIDGYFHDFLCLNYADEDRLLVPVENLDILSRYGFSESLPTLDKLGGNAWEARKASVEKNLLELADKIIENAKTIEIEEGIALQIPESAEEEFAAAFPYRPTDGQLSALEEVREDLQSGHIMDRLVCGDVGFGKTEVALRAAFIATTAGYQVAVVTPTTVLAQQHFQEFSARFTPFGKTVKLFSRFVSPHIIKKQKEMLKNGTIDIAVGTHAILSCLFQKIALVILDEEQHFGVIQKETLKNKKAHILTLSATPIPRTLQLSFAGLKKMSLIETGPLNRTPVKTYVIPSDSFGSLLHQAVEREMEREGQIFYICPRIHQIEESMANLKKLFPDIPIAALHGRMPHACIEKTMADFLEKKYRILVATNIIENGLNIPNANTIIVRNSELFGLSQLYQIRGRVGRSSLQGYCYFVTHHTPNTRQHGERLRVLQHLDKSSNGLSIAAHDLEIRGAGNILGDAQSGHIRTIGIELYQHMLDNCLKERKGEKTQHLPHFFSPVIQLNVSLLIPETYISDRMTRMEIYQKMANTRTHEAIDMLHQEITDRFGPSPPEVKNLIKVCLMKIVCRQQHIKSIHAHTDGIFLSFINDTPADPNVVFRMKEKYPMQVSFAPKQRLYIRSKGINGALKALLTLSKMSDLTPEKN